MAAFDPGWRLGEVALLGAFETERICDTLLFITVKPSAILLVALILESARLEPKHLRKHHADKFGQHTHLLVLRILHLVRRTEHKGATFLTVVMHVDESQDALGILLLTAFDKLFHGRDLRL